MTTGGDAGGVLPGRGDFLALPRLAPLLVALLLAPSLVAQPAPALAAPGAPSATDAAVAAAAVAPVRIAVIDTGIALPHPEFATGQVAAWWDFTDERKPSAHVDPAWAKPEDRHWDPDVEPFDLNGHGTATASLAAGLNADDCGTHRYTDKLSFAPGAPLIIAKVGKQVTDQTGAQKTAIENVGLAVRWAVDMGADVISISLGVIAPIPIHLDEATLRHARASDVLVVVSAGNGLANFGLLPYPSWTSSYGNSPSVLSVGSGDRDGRTLHTTTGNLDPDVTSWSQSVCVASHKGGYTSMTGTSFSAPLVAGMAAGAMQAARDAGKAEGADRIERLLLLASSNNVFVPYAREGMGFLLDAEWPKVREHAAVGSLPRADEQGAHKVADLFYHDVVLERARNTPFL